MEIKNIFSKPIDREIKGVIKVGQNDDANIKQELEEYVVTRELQKHFSDFFSSYKRGINGNTDKMGVWISGFFGSGKSHFLKILSYLLANKKVDGKSAFKYFEEDDKISDKTVLADMSIAATVPTDVVLFNIDSKSEVNGKQSKIAIVSVLQNVFNEMQGFSGSNPFIADLERKLSFEGKFDLFKDKFKERFNNEWTEARNDFDFIQDDVVEVLDDIGFMSKDAGRNWCEKAVGEYPYKVESFAKLVKEYLDKRGNNHHIVFLIDEIGQYIGDDPKLMLNLQTVTEDLGTSCLGKAWIVVTSQQDIDSITKIKGNDFSKIQGRFDTRLSLSSANVDDVIKKRILKKNETGNQTLELLYENKNTVIKNLIVFNDGIEKKLYSSKENFADVYPFIPYQFNLLASVLTSIRQHGASGKHLSEGERSMLSLFKESAVKIKDMEVENVVPFNMFYDSLEQFLDHSHKSVIYRAWDNEILNPTHEKECFDVNVLKTLFMVRYVKEINANLENITSLMVSNINDDRMALSKKVEEALKRLVGQTLVQKNNNTYVFLTDEEQAVNKAIEGQSIDSTEVMNKVSQIIFDDLYSENKYSYPSFKGRYSFAFNQFVDGKPYKSNQNGDINLKILTPNSDEFGDDSTLRLISSNQNSVLVVLPNDRSFLDEIRLSLKIEKFIMGDNEKNYVNFGTIKVDKQKEIRDRNELARSSLSDNLKDSTIYVTGDIFQTNSKDIASRINEAIGKLVSNVYHKLSYINVPMSENDIKDVFKSNGQLVISDAGKKPNELALKEVRDYIAINTQRHTRTSMKTLLDRYMKVPYGFIGMDIQWIVARLFKDEDIALFVNNESISLISKSVDEIFRYLSRKEFNEKLMIETKIKANEKQKKSVREIMKELFKTTLVGETDEDIMQSFINRAKYLNEELNNLSNKYYFNHPEYPGKYVVNDGKKLMAHALQFKNTNEFFNTVDSNKDEYLDFAEDYRPIKNFFDGKQREIFDRATKLMKIYDESKNFIANNNITNITSGVNAILKNNNPYNQISKLPELLDKFTDIYNLLLQEMQEPVDNSIEDAKKRVFEELEGKLCQNTLKGKFAKLFSEIKDKAEKCNNVAILQNIKIEADVLKIRCLDEIESEESKLISLKNNDSVEKNENNEDIKLNQNISSKPAPKVNVKKTISIKSINCASTWRLESEEDVKRYISELEKKLIDSLEDGVTINVEF